MPLSIGDFSLVSRLSPQTLRHYHAEGLLVPAEVDERTGYRGYAFEQVEQAVLVGALRRAGLGVRQVRAALQDPAGVPALLTGQRGALERRRREEDAALADAWTLVTDRPRVQEREVPAGDVVVARVPGGGRPPGDAEVVPAHVATAARALAAALRERGAGASGSPWCAHLLRTPEQRAELFSPDGPGWECAVPLAAGAARVVLPEGAVLAGVPAHREVSVRVLGRETTATFSAAVLQLLRHALERDLVPDLGRPRHVLLEDGVEVAVQVRSLGAEPAVERATAT